jgi:hypothetical protein
MLINFFHVFEGLKSDDLQVHIAVNSGDKGRLELYSTSWDWRRLEACSSLSPSLWMPSLSKIKNQIKNQK